MKYICILFVLTFWGCDSNPVNNSSIGNGVSDTMVAIDIMYSDSFFAGKESLYCDLVNNKISNKYFKPYDICIYYVGIDSNAINQIPSNKNFRLKFPFNDKKSGTIYYVYHNEDYPNDEIKNYYPIQDTLGPIFINNTYLNKSYMYGDVGIVLRYMIQIQTIHYYHTQETNALDLKRLHFRYMKFYYDTRYSPSSSKIPNINLYPPLYFTDN